ncbi:tyrosyl-tRNA synthetase, partial [Linderina pennispora]
TSDADVAKFLKMFTLLPLERIAQVMEEHGRAPEKFAAQKLLAEEVTELIHGEAGVLQAKCATQVLFGGRDQKIEQFSASEIADAFANDRRMVDLPRADAVGKQIAELAVLAGACSSKSQATRLARGGGLYWNNTAVADSKWVPGSDQFIGEGTIGVLRTGKTSYFIIRLK